MLGKRPTQGLDNTTLKAEAKYSINFTESGITIMLSLHYNERNSFLFGRKIYQLKAKDLETKPYPLCLGNISKDFTHNNMKKQH